MVVGTKLGKRSPRGLSSPCVAYVEWTVCISTLNCTTCHGRPAGMCLTDGQILTGQGRDGAPFSRIREEEFDGNPGNERGIERGWD